MSKKRYDPNGLKDYDNSHWNGVDRVMLKIAVWWTIGWTSLAAGLLIYHL